MIKLSAVPNIRVQRMKIELPYNQKDNLKGSLVVVSSDSVEGFANVVNNKLLYTNRHLYHYTPMGYNRKIFNRTVILRTPKERNDDNEYVIKNTNLKSNLLLHTIDNRNLFFDMSRWNQIFTRESKRQINYEKRCEEYFELLSDIFNDSDFNGYSMKTLVIDLDYIGKSGIRDMEKKDEMASPLNLMYYAMRKHPELFSKLKGIDILFLSDNSYIKVKPETIDRNSYSTFRIELNKIGRLMVDDKEFDKDVAKAELISKASNTLNQMYNFTGEEEEEIVNKIVEDEVDEKENDLLTDDGSKEEYEKDDKKVAKLVTDPELINKIADEIKVVKVPKSASTKRDELLKEKQKEIKINGRDINSILSAKESLDNPIPVNDVSASVDTTNPNITKIRYANFDKVYNEKYLEKDIINNILQMNNAQIKVFVRDIKVEDTSNELNAKQTYTVLLEDEYRVRHTLTFDIPKFIDNKFLYLNGNRKVINRQLFFKPIIKIEEDTVQVVSNYNKIFLRRYGKKLSVKTEKFRKLIEGEVKGIKVKAGNNLKANNKFETTIEYDELSKSYDYIKVANVELFFNQEEVYDKAASLGLKIPDDKMLIGFEDKNKTVLVDRKTQMIDGKDIIDYIMDKTSDEAKSLFDSTTTGKKFLYSRATIMARQVPLILLLSYCEGLTTVLRKAEIKHYFTDKRPRISNDEGVVQFSNGYLVYEKYPFENSLLMNAFADIPTKGFTYEDFDNKETYVLIFEAMFNQRNLASAFDNFYDFMIDPITKEILQDLDYPTEFVDVMIYANRLLADNSYTNENDMSLYRVRSNELVSVYLYKAITKAYGDYRRTAYNNNPKKISIRKDAILKDVLMAQTIEDYSTLNPVVELEKSRVISAKGPSGLNLAQAYTMDKRGYDKTMIGTIGISTSPDSNVGVVRQLTKEPNITSVRGYIKVEEDLDKVKDANLFSPAELLSPLGASRDDSSRTAINNIAVAV